MTGMKVFTEKTGYTRTEFGSIFQCYARSVYRNIFRDLSISEHQGKYLISFREEAGTKPLITIEKKKLGPDRVLFTATTPGPRNTLMTVARSEKIASFCEQLEKVISALESNRSKNAAKHG
ncbi:MAG: hypothetical protein AB7E85_03090 [Pseudobdellovibrionaceae bacterium]